MLQEENIMEIGFHNFFFCDNLFSELLQYFNSTILNFFL